MSESGTTGSGLTKYVAIGAVVVALGAGYFIFVGREDAEAEAATTPAEADAEPADDADDADETDEADDDAEEPAASN